MTEEIVRRKPLDRIKGIHALSSQYNQSLGKDHQERLLELMESHVEEIEELAREKNPHLLVETGDLMILCFEMLLEHGASVDDILEQCCGRYERKLSKLIREADSRHGGHQELPANNELSA